MGKNHFKGALSILKEYKKHRNSTSWKKIEDNKPICFENGDYPGLKSKLLILKTSRNIFFIGFAYEVDGDYDFYTSINDNIINNVVEWMDVPN